MTASLGFGQKPWGYGGYGSPLAPPVPAVESALSSSRKVDFVTGRYVANDEGGFEAMDDTAQRVVLLVAFAVKRSTFLTAQSLAGQEAAIRNALLVVTRGPAPEIRVLSVSAVATDVQTSAVSIRYVNNLTGTEQTVSPRQ